MRPTGSRTWRDATLRVPPALRGATLVKGKATKPVVSDDGTDGGGILGPRLFRWVDETAMMIRLPRLPPPYSRDSDSYGG